MEKGSRNAKSCGTGGSGLRNRMLMPRFMKGVVKSTACSRSAVIVRSVIANSTFCNLTHTMYLPTYLAQYECTYNYDVRSAHPGSNL